MKIKEIANLTELSERTIQRKVKKMFPEIIQNGINTDLNENQSIQLVNECRVKLGKQIKPRQDVRQNVELVKSILEPILKQQNEFNQAILTEIKNLKEDNKKQIEYKNNKIIINKITVKDFVEKNNIKCFNQMALLIQAGKQAARLSKELHREISFTNDGQFNVGLYDEDIMQTAVFNAKMAIEKENNLFAGIK